MVSEERREIYRNFEELRKTGLSVNDAAKRLGKYAPYFYKIKSELLNEKKKKAKKPETIVVPETAPLPTGMVFMFYGNPEQVAQVARGLQ